MIETPHADDPELQVTAGTSRWKGEAMVCAERESPIPPSALEAQNLMVPGADDEGPTCIFQRCAVYRPEEVEGRSRSTPVSGRISGSPVPCGCLHPSVMFRDRRTGAGRGYRGSSDGSCASSLRQRGHRRFCRRSQLQNCLSQRRQVVRPA